MASERREAGPGTPTTLIQGKRRWQWWAIVCVLFSVVYLKCINMYDLKLEFLSLSQNQLYMMKTYENRG